MLRKPRSTYRLDWGQVSGDFPIKTIQEVALLADEFWNSIQSTLRGSTNFPISIKVVGNRKFKKTCKTCGIEGAGAFYDEDDHEITIQWDLIRPDHLIQYIAHEIAHAYFHSAFGFVGSTWFSEGLAQYFEYFSVVGGRPVPGAIPEVMVWKAYMTLKRFCLADLLWASRKEFYRADAKYEKTMGTLYPVAWAFVYFLSSQEGFSELIERNRKGEIDDLFNYEEMFLDALQALAYTSKDIPAGAPRSDRMGSH